MALAAQALASMLLFGPGVRLTWDAPPPCPDAPALTADVERHLDSPLADVTADLEIAASARRAEQTWTVVIALTSEAGARRRTVEHVGECREVARTAALVIAIAIEEAMSRPPAEATPAPVPSPPPDARPAPPASPGPPDTARPLEDPRRGGPKLRGAIRIGGGISFGDLPDFGGAVALYGSLVWRPARLELTALYGPRRTKRVPDGDEGARFSLWTVGARGCPVPRIGPVEFPICAGFEAGQLLATPVGLAQGQRAAAAWGAFVLAPGIHYVPVRLVSIGVFPELIVPFSRPVFEAGDATGAQQLHRPAPAAIRAFVGFEVRFP